ncbi:RagB/SusD family nutrient uptake outer membrane protein [Flammeovirga sp. SubArs3]|uniref:RagB/SusD family nutrient uptake outer membrane protein n=1 Tax=Flammeovirga sp. SubArs3 TaxID=2995316 RepID=UPI00248B6EB4|nr:RagB/SusD family nutrient uptake outer membrane protein [Flammeovirga sp. SubArs3]
MKRILYILLIAFTLPACESFLDRSPDLGLVEEDIYTDYFTFRAFNDRLYGHMDDQLHWDRRDDLGSVADETQNNYEYGFSTDMNSGGNYSTSSKSKLYESGWEAKTADGKPKWGAEAPPIWNAIQAIRVANLTFKNIEMLEGATEEQVNELLGQAYFFRAFYYFQILIRWGGQPRMDFLFESDEDYKDLERRDFVTSAQDCIEDLDASLLLLPSTWPSDQHGRVTKGSALALKGMILLYMGSPLMQEDATGAAAYNNDLLLESLKAQSELIQRQGEFGVSLGTNYADIFFRFGNPGSSEVLLWKNRGTRSKGDLTNHFIPKSYGGANATTGPTQNMVDMFEMESGLPITDPASNYDPTSPYEGRDPRFYNNILYNGAEWGVNGQQQIYIETFTGGREDNLPDNQASRTGYFVKKFWPKGSNHWEKRWSQHYMPWVYIRLSQVYLDFAEAANEVYGPTAVVPEAGISALQAVNIIRNRVGMPDVNSKYTGDKALFRDRIRNERAVELCFEGHRWFDIRRWKIAEEKLATIKRVVIKKSSDGSLEYSYPVLKGVRNFRPRNYWYPIPIDEIAKYNNYTQNTGW